MASRVISGGGPRLRLSCAEQGAWLMLRRPMSMSLYFEPAMSFNFNLRSWRKGRGGGEPNVNGRRRACATNSSSPSPSEQRPPQEAVLKAISEVSKTEGRVAHTRNVVMGGTITGESADEWKVLDQKVNSYPTVRGFIAIGTGGDDFVQAMVGAVESVLQHPIPEGRVTHKLSSRGKYVSVNIGPVKVDSSEQVQAVYNAMRRDIRMKYFL
uniref:Uncharacterized protein n=1 Tax=Araucaria cunninghamii TaxID=56994 RepID=A0A0D6R999_ARACU